MVAMREVPRLALEPGRVRWIWSADERERPSQRVDDLLVMPRLRHEPFGAPTPARRQLPVAQMPWELVRDAVYVGVGGQSQHALHARLGQYLFGMVRELRNERDIRKHLDVDLLDAMLFSVGARRALQ